MAGKLEAHVAKAVRQAPAKELGDLLAKLVLARLTSRQRTKQQTSKPTLRERIEQEARRATEQSTSSRSRRSARRIGRNKYYTPTSKPDVSRMGTFRHYMIKTIREHTSTRAAEQAHSVCDNPKYAKNRLDFNWAADNGFINWD